MNHLEDMEIFVQAAKLGTFFAAASALHISPAKVSTHISRLERRLKVTLFDRTTRTLKLTAEGSVYLPHCQHILSEIVAADFKLAKISQSPSGLLRIDVAVSFINEMLLPVLSRFFERYPEISLELTHSMHLLDLGHQTCDVMLRAGPLEDSSLIGIPLGYSKLITVAAPAYLAKHGEPLNPQELLTHNCLQFSDPRSGRIENWLFQKGDMQYPIKTSGNLTFNEGVSRVAASIQGYGIYQGLEFLLHRWIKSGDLQVILKAWQGPTRPILMAFEAQTQPSAKLRAFVDFMREMYPGQAEIRPATAGPV